MPGEEALFSGRRFVKRTEAAKQSWPAGQKVGPPPLKGVGMHPTTLIAFIGLEIVLCFIPGPAVLSVIGAALGGTWRAGLATAFGILTGNAIYFVVSALGIASAIAASHTAFAVIKWCGAAYLAYLGIRSLMTREKAIEPTRFSHDERHAARGWLTGTIVQLSNPKALVFFTAILPQFVDPRGNLWLQIAVLGAAGLAVELGVLGIYTAAADRIAAGGFDPKRQLWAHRAGGLCLVGVALAVARRA